MITYAGVPSAVSDVAVYEWSDTASPRALQWHITRLADDIVVDGVTRRSVIVLFVRPDGAYLIDGPLTWSEHNERRVLKEQWRRTERGRIPEGISTTPRSSGFAGTPCRVHGRGASAGTPRGNVGASSLAIAAL